MQTAILQAYIGMQEPEDLMSGMGRVLKSIDERAFSDFSIDGSEKDWRQGRLEDASMSYNGDARDNNRDDTADIIRDQAIDDMREAREEELAKSLYGYQYTEEQFDAAIIAYLKDWEENTKDLTDEQKEFVRDRLDKILNSDNPEDRNRWREEINEVAPEVQEELEIRAENNGEVPEQIVSIGSDVETRMEQAITTADPVVKPATISFG